MDPPRKARTKKFGDPKRPEPLVPVSRRAVAAAADAAATLISLGSAPATTTSTTNSNSNNNTTTITTAAAAAPAPAPAAALPTDDNLPVLLLQARVAQLKAQVKDLQDDKAALQADKVALEGKVAALEAAANRVKIEGRIKLELEAREEWWGFRPYFHHFFETDFAACGTLDAVLAELNRLASPSFFGSLVRPFRGLGPIWVRQRVQLRCVGGYSIFLWDRNEAAFAEWAAAEQRNGSKKLLAELELLATREVAVRDRWMGLGLHVVKLEQMTGDGEMILLEDWVVGVEGMTNVR